MELLTFDEMRRTWHQIAHHQKEILPLSFELEVYKKLLSLFHVGDYYYYIFNTAEANIEFVNENFSPIIGHNSGVFTVGWLFEHIHPEDKSRFISFEHKVTDFFSLLKPEQVLKYKVSYDYRLRCADGNYKWLLQQVTTIQSDENGAVIRVLGVHTDITHLKTDNQPSGLSFIGLDGEPSYHNVAIDNQTSIANREIFTPREKEILRLVLVGKSTFEIADLLHISKHTVDTHRKNIFSKSGCNSLVELGSKAVQERWI